MPKATPLKFGPCFAVSSVFAAMAPLTQLPAVADDTAAAAQHGPVTSDPTRIVNLAVNYDWLRFTIGLELLNALETKDADITYFFESQLPGKAAPVEDRHFRPVEPRQVRATIRYRF